jgi:glycosyltransferase involved in cell wall biosynthesis
MDRSSPRITVGIPCYNRASGLKGTLKAITNQTYQNLEIIISDNCSEDPSVKAVAEEFVSSDLRVSYVRQESNLGALGNFLYLAEYGTSEYFMWAADDDWWAPEFIEEMVRLLQEDREAVVGFCRTIPIEDDYSRHKLYPDFYPAMCEFKDRELGRRITSYIHQKDAFGKAHFTYGLHRAEILRDCLRKTIGYINPKIKVDELLQFDVLLCASLLTYGHLVLSEQLLRRFGSGPRKSPRREPQSLSERFLRYDGRSLIYLDCYFPMIEELGCGDTVKCRLVRIVKRKKLNFIFERIGRRFFIYKVYWHFFKKMKYKTLGELAGKLTSKP